MREKKKSIAYCGSSTAAAVHKPQYTRDFFLPCVLRHLVKCSAVDVPQFEFIYTVPLFHNNVLETIEFAKLKKGFNTEMYLLDLLFLHVLALTRNGVLFTKTHLYQFQE